MDSPVAARIAELGYAVRHFTNFLETVSYFEQAQRPGVCDFALGNPQDMPLPNLVQSLERASTPLNKDWFAYKLSEPQSQATVAAALENELGIAFEPEDIAMTPGAFGALAVALQVVVDPGDEVIINLPPWFFYEGLIVAAGGVPVKVEVDRETLDLDLDAIEAAISPKTRAIIVNSPNNPTGRIYPASTLERLAAILERASERNGKNIYLISDEPYRKIRFDNADFPTPLAYYAHSMMTTPTERSFLRPVSASATSQSRRPCLTGRFCGWQS
jgi:aspartate aminotransferase